MNPFRALGCEQPPELEIVDGERTVECFINDFGPGGVANYIRRLVYSDLGLPPPVERPPAAIGADTVRDALRSFRDARVLAGSPLARGVSADERAASVRRVLREAVAASFGESEDERLLRSVLELGYLEPDTSHIDAQRRVAPESGQLLPPPAHRGRTGLRVRAQRAAGMRPT